MKHKKQLNKNATNFLQLVREENAREEESKEAKKLTVLIVEPNKSPYVKEIPNTLHDQQEIVGGLIEPIIFDVKNGGKREVAVVVNEEGLLEDLPLCRVVHVMHPSGEGYMEYKFHGTFYVVAYDMTDGETVSLDEEEINEFRAIFSGFLSVLM